MIRNLEPQTPSVVLPKIAPSSYSKTEDLWNVLSHGLGLICAVVFLILMILQTKHAQNGIKLYSALIYGSSLVLLFLTSTVYHSLKSPTQRALWKTLDHCAIYLLIAGTYTPYLLVSFDGNWRIILMLIIWTVAIFGIFFKVYFGHQYPKVSLFTYLLMGWFMVIASKELMAKVPSEGLYLLIYGGLAYSFGAIFYAIKKIPFNHAIWHLFVLAGATFHFLSIYRFVL